MQVKFAADEPMLRCACGLRGSGTKDCCVLCTHKRNTADDAILRDDLPEHQRTLNRGFVLGSDGHWIGKVRLGIVSTLFFPPPSHVYNLGSFRFSALCSRTLVFARFIF